MGDFGIFNRLMGGALGAYGGGQQAMYAAQLAGQTWQPWLYLHPADDVDSPYFEIAQWDRQFELECGYLPEGSPIAKWRKRMGVHAALHNEQQSAIIRAIEKGATGVPLDS